MKKFLIKLILAGVVLGAATAWAAWDRTANYEQVTAEVTRVDEVCYMKKTERGIASKTTTTTKEGPCPIITALNQTHPEYQDFDLVKVTTVEFRDRSPADGKVHRGKQREENRRETGLKLRRGDDLVVLAHKTKPEETRRY